MCWSRTTGRQPPGHHHSSCRTVSWAILPKSLKSLLSSALPALGEALMKYRSAAVPLLQWLAEAHYSSSCASSCSDINYFCIAGPHLGISVVHAGKAHTAPWDACQEQFLIKLSLCQSFPRTWVLLIFLPALLSQSNNLGSKKTQGNLCIKPKRKWACLSAWKTEAICVNPRTRGKGQTDTPEAQITLVQTQGH